MSNPSPTTDAARDAGQPPNYRIYDRTGGGVTHDIYAETLEDAIEQGRAWIEDGDWSGDEQDGTYRTIALDCCLREIVRVPDLRSIEALPAVWDVQLGEDGALVLHVDGARAAQVREMLAGSAARLNDGQSDPDAEGEVIILGQLNRVPQMIDEDATACGQGYDCSGTYTAEKPECDADDSEGEHDWTSDDGAPVGGIRENPGVWSLGGTRMSYRTCCRHCGRYRRETDPGCQRNPDEATLTVTIEDADEASKKWIEQNSAALTKEARP